MNGSFVTRAVGNVHFTVIPLREAVALLLDEAAFRTHERDDTQRSRHRRLGVSAHFANAYNVAIARTDAEYARLLNTADYVFSDGVPVTWVGKRAHPDEADDWERVYGPDVMNMVLAVSTADGPAHYLLGGSPEVLDQLQDAISAKYPQARVVGAESPPFRPASPEELAERDQRIRDSGATMVWVGLGTPKQDYEVARIAEQLPVVSLAVGAAFDFIAGSTSQAPVWMQRNGLEWAYRLSQEPRRLGRRYLWGNSVFLLEAARTLSRNR